MSTDVSLIHPTAARCSSELADNLRGVIRWGRGRWPDARVILELQVGGCRLDVAFVCPAQMIGVEVKSARDTLGRLDRQLQHFCREVPEMWVAVAPKWLPKIDDVPSRVGRLVVEGDAVCEDIPLSHGGAWKHRSYPDEMLTSHMLHLLWKAEARALAAKHSVKVLASTPLYAIVKVLARRLTGDQIVEGVCAALRGRPINHAADMPIFDTPPRPNSDGVGEAGETEGAGRP